MTEPLSHLPPSRRGLYAELVVERYTRADEKCEKAVQRALAEFVDRLDRYDLKEAG